MNKKEEKELEKIIEQTVKALGGVVDNQKEFSNLLDKIVRLIEFLMKSVSLILFILFLLVWRVFIWQPFSNLLDGVVERWSLLSEGYQILILGFIGAIIAGIIAHVASVLLLEKIKKILSKKINARRYHKTKN